MSTTCIYHVQCVVVIAPLMRGYSRGEGLITTWLNGRATPRDGEGSRFESRSWVLAFPHAWMKVGPLVTVTWDANSFTLDNTLICQSCWKLSGRVNFGNNCTFCWIIWVSSYLDKIWFTHNLFLAISLKEAGGAQKPNFSLRDPEGRHLQHS